jgi:hypothetical protein
MYDCPLHRTSAFAAAPTAARHARGNNRVGDFTGARIATYLVSLACVKSSALQRRSHLPNEKTSSSKDGLEGSLMCRDRIPKVYQR